MAVSDIPMWHRMFTTKVVPSGRTAVQERREEEFDLVFGPRPQRQNYGEIGEYNQAVTDWEQKKLYFGGIIPPTPGQAIALDEFAVWGFGRGIIYQDRYWPMVYFPDADIGPQDLIAATALAYPQRLIAKRQSAAIEGGKYVPKLIPLVGSDLRRMNDQNRGR